MKRNKPIATIVLPAIKPRNPLAIAARQMKACRHQEPVLDRGRQRREDLASARLVG